jgi:hypothetical protein
MKLYELVVVSLIAALVLGSDVVCDRVWPFM